MRHELKTWPEYFQAVKEGHKPFEIRQNDRNYRVGDVLILKEWVPTEIMGAPVHITGYTGEEVNAEVTYITDFAQQPGWVVLGIKLIGEETACRR